MAYTCNNCGASAEKPGHLCNPCDDKEDSCSFCGTPDVDSKHVCKDKLSEVRYVCGGCGRVAVEEAAVCNPQPIIQ